MCRVWRSTPQVMISTYTQHFDEEYLDKVLVGLTDRFENILAIIPSPVLYKSKITRGKRGKSQVLTPIIVHLVSNAHQKHSPANMQVASPARPSRSGGVRGNVHRRCYGALRQQSRSVDMIAIWKENVAVAVRVRDNSAAQKKRVRQPLFGYQLIRGRG